MTGFWEAYCSCYVVVYHRGCPMRHRHGPQSQYHLRTFVSSFYSISIHSDTLKAILFSFSVIGYYCRGSYLCADVIYVALFPQLLLVIYGGDYTNTYGSFTSFVLGFMLRILSKYDGSGLTCPSNQHKSSIIENNIRASWFNRVLWNSDWRGQTAKWKSVYLDGRPEKY